MCSISLLQLSVVPPPSVFTLINNTAGRARSTLTHTQTVIQWVNNRNEPTRIAERVCQQYPISLIQPPLWPRPCNASLLIFNSVPVPCMQQALQADVSADALWGHCRGASLKQHLKQEVTHTSSAAMAARPLHHVHLIDKLLHIHKHVSVIH